MWKDLLVGRRDGEMVSFSTKMSWTRLSILGRVLVVRQPLGVENDALVVVAPRYPGRELIPPDVLRQIARRLAGERDARRRRWIGGREAARGGRLR